LQSSEKASNITRNGGTCAFLENYV
jgi:hypothetical protein